MTEQRYRILAADKLATEGLDWIGQQTDAQLVSRPGISEQELAEIIGDFDAVIVRSGVQITAAVLERPGRLKVIARAGVGVDNIDLDAATAKGILVVNSAEASTITTAEHAFALMIARMRNIGPAYRAMYEGKWDRNLFSGWQLAGKTLGVVGFGRIGRTLAERALAFEMEVVAYDPFINARTMLDGKVRMFSDFTAMIPHADILSFHVPLNDQTRSMLNDTTFELCRPGVLVVNASRGGVVDEAALVRAMDSGRCGGCAIDVFEEEPPAADHPLRRHPKALVTPHLGASTAEAQVAVSVDAAASALAYLRGEGIRGAVNAGGVRVDLEPALQRYADLARRMAMLIGPMVTRGMAEIRIELTGRSLAPAAGTIERMVLVELLQKCMDEPVNVISVASVAAQRSIAVSTTITDPPEGAGNRIRMEVMAPEGQIDDKSHAADRSRLIVGRVLSDGRPRVVEINGYHMDMVPAGDLLLIQNQDKPGMVGRIGTLLGEAGLNISDLSLSHRDRTSLMMIRTLPQAGEGVLQGLRALDGVIKVATVSLPQENRPGVE